MNDIQVMSVNGVPYDAKSWQDTVALPVGGTVVMRMRVRTFTGMYVFHCHILNHGCCSWLVFVTVHSSVVPSRRTDARRSSSAPPRRERTRGRRLSPDDVSTAS